MAPLKDLIIIGAGGFGREVEWVVERINQASPTWNFLGFADDNPEWQGRICGNSRVICTVSGLSRYSSAFVVCAVGSSQVRRKIISRLPEDIKFATLVDPSVLQSSSVRIGEGSIICAGTILTVDIIIGKHSIINLDCTIGHDVVSAPYLTVYPSVNISGTCNMGECVELGTGTQIIQGKTIGDGAIIGAGSVVVRDIPSQCTAVGCPAKPIKFHE